ncbi:SRPBCC family protein [Puniceicoccaceae bacterium K14]|nr:SRPBCC family protein [Puniceicoccaceae bacterium K14]
MEFTVEASAEKAWSVLGEQYGDIGGFLSSMISTRLEGELGVGASRVCESAGFGPFPTMIVKEKLIKFDPKGYAFTYRAKKGLPVFIHSAQNAWTIEPKSDNRCVVRSRAEVDLAWWAKPLGIVLPSLMARDFRKVEEELKYRIEKDRPHPRKREIVRKLNNATA